MAENKLPNGLTPRQDRFARLHGSGKGKREAAVEAGYSEKTAHVTASRLLRNDKVTAIVEQVAKDAADRIDVDAAFVLGGLKSNAAVGAERTVIEMDDGTILAGKPIDLSASNAALGLLGKHLRLFTDRTEVVLTDEAKAYLDTVAETIDTVACPECRESILKALAGVES